ncbi:MAG: hypothetical protein V4519_01860 [Patescibacteria group bacterium]
MTVVDNMDVGAALALMREELPATLSGDEVKAVCDECTDRRLAALAPSTVSTVNVTCMDFRFCIKSRHALRTMYGVEKLVDLVTFAGGAYSFAATSGAPWWQVHKHVWIWCVKMMVRFVMCISLRVAIYKHGVERIVLCGHEQCGLCCLHGHHFDTMEDDRAFHQDRLRAAGKWLRKKFPEVKVICLCFLYMDGEGDVQLKEFEQM